ncbi:MAG: DUF2298 domain-containing protein [Candidatus Methanoperedenaceae archaeon]|nr:DUF2298 domain-containing protein [Candidatus Methanoperedenaceae archaeon]
MIRSTNFPLFDPWFAGATANYYYFGYIIVGNLMKLINSNILIGFNIASAAFYAISFTGALGIGYNLTSKLKFGFITAFFIAIIGNLIGFVQGSTLYIKNKWGLRI